MNNWILHDSFKSQEEVEEIANSIVVLGLTKGIKIKKSNDKKRSFELYILPLKKGN
jgi:hypothetical protein